MFFFQCNVGAWYQQTILISNHISARQFREGSDGDQGAAEPVERSVDDRQSEAGQLLG